MIRLRCKICNSSRVFYDKEMESYTCDDCGSTSDELVRYDKCKKKS